MCVWHVFVARYGFWDADQDDDVAFDRRLSAVLREVGDRGKLVLSEAVPPSFREPTPAPAPAPAPVRASAAVATRLPAPALAPVPAPAPARSMALAALASAPTAPATVSSPATPRTDAPQQSYTTSSMQQHDSMQISTLGTERQGGTTAAGVSLMEVSTFMTEQLKAVARMEARMDKQAVEAKAEREAMQTRLEQQQAEIQAQTEARLRAELRAQPAITESDLTTLQTRLEGLHAVELLSEAELASLEDVLADFFEASAGCDVVTMEIVNMHRAVGQVHMMIAVSKGMAKDPMFARQLKRKFC